MKNVYRIFLTTALMVGIFNANAQNRQPNRCTIGSKNHSVTVEASANAIVNKVSDKIISTCISSPESKTIHATAETHNLFIKPEGEWNSMRIVGPNGFHSFIMSFIQDEFNEVVEDGDYVVFVVGRKNDNGTACWLGYDVTVDHDISMSPSMDEAQFQVSVEGKDENGNPLEQQTFFNNTTEVYIGFKQYGNGLISIEGSPFSILCNELSDNFSISASQLVSVENQTSYFINYPVHFGKIEGDLLLTNDPSEFETNLSYFSLKNNNSGTNVTLYSVDYTWYCISQNDDIYYYTTANSQNTEMTLDSSLPIRVITNNKIDKNGMNLYYDKGYCVVKPFVTVYENFNPDVYSDYHQQIVSTGIYMDDENNWIREPFRDIPYLWNIKAMDYFDPITPTPSASVVSVDQPMYLGERTPIFYWQSENFGPLTSLWGETYLGGAMEFFGDNGCIRKSNECANVKINAGGEEIFNDSLFYFNANGSFYIDAPCAVEMEINDNYLIDDGIEKFNNTRISFDLNRDDAMPPTMTILKVMNAEGVENVFLPDYANSNINFAAGDFDVHDAGGWFDKMLYKAKPSVEVFYAIANGDWMPLECTENEELFHVNYGNVFTIELSQLDANVAGQWVSLKFVVTDEAGNSQTQELSNVFFAGQQTTVNEQTSTVAHTVYPNPFSGEVHINAAEAVNGMANISVFNVLGEQVISKAMQCNGTTGFVIVGSCLNAGIYFYNIATENGKLQGRIVKALSYCF